MEKESIKEKQRNFKKNTKNHSKKEKLNSFSFLLFYDNFSIIELYLANN